MSLSIRAFVASIRLLRRASSASIFPPRRASNASIFPLRRASSASIFPPSPVPSASIFPSRRKSAVASRPSAATSVDSKPAFNTVLTRRLCIANSCRVDDDRPVVDEAASSFLALIADWVASLADQFRNPTAKRTSSIRPICRRTDGAHNQGVGPQHSRLCPGCAGSGKCWVCRGVGWHRQRDGVTVSCRRCDGTGECHESQQAEDGRLGAAS
jgi:hypothetical protein